MADEILSILARPAAQCAIRWDNWFILLCLLRKGGAFDRTAVRISPGSPPCRLCLRAPVSHLGSVISLTLIRSALKTQDLAAARRVHYTLALLAPRQVPALRSGPNALESKMSPSLTVGCPYCITGGFE
jgi:hypothetical protein